jgi:hypothetical protein
VRTPSFIDELSHPGFQVVRSVEVLTFATEQEALAHLSKQPGPRFLFDICPQEVAQLNNPMEDREPKDHYFIRAAIGLVPKPTPEATLEVFRKR